MSDVRTEDAPAAAQQKRTGPNPPGDFIWYELVTPDPDGAKSFYDAVVRWDIEPEPSGEAAMDYRMIRSGGGNAGGVMRLTDEMVAQGARPTWLGYINVADVDATVAAIEKAGGKALMGGFDIPGVGRIALVADPHGAPFYVMRATPPQGQPDAASNVFSPDVQGRCGWNELQTANTDSARGFYGEQFGWDSGDFMDMGEMGEYRFWDHHGQRIGAVFSPGDGRPSAWRYYFRVPSISAAKDAAERNGGTIAMGPHQVPGGDWIVVGRDPQGAEFALVGGQ